MKEFHLFSGIGGGIYGGQLLGHECCGGVEIDDFCNKVIIQRQRDGWLNTFPIYTDITKLSGTDFTDKFDILCGGFPCQAFSHAAHGKNIAEKNLWDEMFRFVQESNAPIVFAENVTEKAIKKAEEDLQGIGYKTRICKLSCEELGGDHRRIRFWLLAVKDMDKLNEIQNELTKRPKLNNFCWINSFREPKCDDNQGSRRAQLKAVGNAQSPIVAATAFRILCGRFFNDYKSLKVGTDELSQYFFARESWIQWKYQIGLVHTPTTMANYSAKSMQKHAGCRNFVKVFNKPTPSNAEYLMGFPIGASSITPKSLINVQLWM